MRINYSWVVAISGCSLAKFPSLLHVLKCNTFEDVSIRAASVILSIFAKVSLAHQLSSQKLILILFPNFHRTPFRNCCRFLSMHLQAQESDFFGFA